MDEGSYRRRQGVRGGVAVNAESILISGLTKALAERTKRYEDLHARYRDVLNKAFPLTVKMAVEGAAYQDPYREQTFYRAVIKPESHVFHATLQYVKDLPEDAVTELVEDAVKRVADDVRQQFTRELDAARRGVLAWNRS